MTANKPIKTSQVQILDRIQAASKKTYVENEFRGFDCAWQMAINAGMKVPVGDTTFSSIFARRDAILKGIAECEG